MEFLWSPIGLNLVMYALLITIVYVGVKSADGFFAVMAVYSIIGFGGFVGPFIIGTVNAIMYLTNKTNGYLIGIVVAIGVFILFNIYAHLDSRDFYVHHFKGKKVNAVFKNATNLNPTEYINYVLDGNKHGFTKIHLKRELTNEQLNAFSIALNQMNENKGFELYVNRKFLQYVKKTPN